MPCAQIASDLTDIDSSLLDAHWHWPAWGTKLSKLQLHDCCRVWRPQLSSHDAQFMPESYKALSLWLIGAYFVLLLISLVRRGQVISGPWWFLLRSFFPNWRFYHGPGNQPRLFWRTSESQGQWTSWQMFMPRAHFAWHDCLHNPRNNLTLANQNLVDHLSADIAALPEDGDVRDLVTYQLVQRLSRWLISCEGISPERYQFQLRLVPPLVTMADEELAILTSPALDW